MLTTRVLPHAEFSRLAGTGWDECWPLLVPDCVIPTVEHDGQIVGTWGLMRLWTAEGAWIHPDYRKSGVVAAKLLRSMRTAAEEAEVAHVLTHAREQSVRDLLANHLDAPALVGPDGHPMTVHSWKVGG